MAFSNEIKARILVSVFCFYATLFADSAPPSLSSSAPNSLITIQTAPTGVDAYLNTAVFKQLSNYGKCSMLAISYHNSFEGKTAPFHIFSDSVGDSVVLKASTLDGSGNSTPINTQGKFDKVLSLDTEVEDFPGQTPTFKYAVASAARVVDLSGVNSPWKGSSINPTTNSFDPAFFGDYVFNNPSKG